MKSNFFNTIFKITVLVIAVLGLSTCNTSKKASGTANMFKIPKKIVKAEDLPPVLQNEKQSPVHYVQLYPDEKPQGDYAVAEQSPIEQMVLDDLNKQETIPEQPEVAEKAEPEITDIEKFVEEKVEDITHNRPNPIYYHIVSGSFQNKLYADLFAKHLVNIGYGNTFVRFFDNGFNRVIVQRYVNEVEARQYLQGYRSDNPQYSDAWLYYKADISNDPMALLTK